ncbi:MAG TPA: VTT domain-containing protein [Acidobacteriota bacterium]|nr:VTT domain-containing protein [Acidobacteriota bacterium]
MDHTPSDQDQSPRTQGEKPRSRNPLRRLYAWVLTWADRKGGTVALAVLGVAESSVFPVPPDPLLMALCLGKPRRSLFFAAVLSVASVLGGVIGYGIGVFLWDTWGSWFFANVPGLTQQNFDLVAGWYHKWEFWAVFVAGLTPIPYKVFTIAGGVFRISFPVFFLASAISRSARFFLIAVLLYFYGPSIERFIDRYLGWLTLLFAALLVGGFLLLR